MGSIGAAAAYYLAKEGQKVLGLEQFDIPHERGAHAGQTRIIRKAYFEAPDYVPLLERSYDLWKSLEQESGQQLFFPTGILYFGTAETETMQSVQKSAELHQLPIEHWPLPSALQRYPGFDIPSHWQSILEPDAGYVLAEKTVEVLAQSALKYGAEIKTGVKVLAWKSLDSGVEVETDIGFFYAEKLIITGGAWAGKLLPELKERLTVTEQLLVWVEPEEPKKFESELFPCWFIDDPERGMFYGFPYLARQSKPGVTGLKLAHHSPGKVVDPDNRNDEILEEELDAIRYVLKKFLPSSFGQLTATKKCLYTNSPDGHFIVDFLPETAHKVAVCCGLSGHGFKFVPVLGKLLSEMAISGTLPKEIEFIGLSRF